MSIMRWLWLALLVGLVWGAATHLTARHTEAGKPLASAKAVWTTKQGQLVTSNDGSLDSVDVASGAAKVIVNGMPDKVDSVVSAPVVTDVIAYVTVDSYFQAQNSSGALLLVDVTPQGASSWQVLASGSKLSGAKDIAWIPNTHNLLISCTSGLQFLIYNTDTGALNAWGPAIAPAGLVFMPNGQFWVNDENAKTLDRLDPVSGAVLKTFPLPDVPDGLVYDPALKMFFINTDGGMLLSFNLATKAVNVLLTGFHYLDGLDDDGAGNLFTVDYQGRGLIALPIAKPKAYHILAPNPSDGTWDDVAPLLGPGQPPTPTDTPRFGTTNTPTPTPSDTPTVTSTRTPVVAWVTFGYDRARDHDNTYETKLTTSTVPSLQVDWTYRTSGHVDSSPAISGTTVYVGSDDRSVYAFNTSDGSVLWKYATRGQVHSSPTLWGNSVYVGSDDDTLYALDSATGAVQWMYGLNNAVQSSPAVDSTTGYVAVTSLDGWITILHADTGRFIWHYQMGNAVQAAPTMGQGRVYCGSYDGKVYSFNEADGSLRWSVNLGDVKVRSVAYVNTVLYLTSYQGDILALNAGTGKTLWKVSTDATSHASPAFGSGIIYLGADDGIFRAINVSTKKIKWSYATGDPIESSAAVGNGVVYVGTDGGKLFAFNAQTGAVLWQYQTGSIIGNPVISSPAILFGQVFVGSDDLSLYSFALPSSRPRGLTRRL